MDKQQYDILLETNKNTKILVALMVASLVKQGVSNGTIGDLIKRAKEEL